MLSGRATAALVALGWYDDIVARARPCDAILSRWASPEYVERTALLEPGGHGWIIDRSWFDPLVRRLAVRDGVTRVATSTQAPSTGRRVLATGKHAPPDGMRRVLGPDRVALTAAGPTGAVRGLGHRLTVEAVAAGWWSAVDDGVHVAVTYVTDPVVLRRHGGLDQAWRAVVRAAPGWLPADFRAIRPRVRPIRNRLQAGLAGPVRVGDCALSVDPLSGHGLALALETGLRWHDSDYPAWLAEQADRHADDGLAAHAAVPYETDYWQAGRSC
ncbi:hypothetical protein [Micromonospora sp. DT47]|uniref:hypothetical protein n=1 Tax=Micromonospora sp. DT47 TaxID=3393431 RepID=UPI003CF751C6